MKKNSILKINNYELYLHIGIDESERKKKQKILLSIEIYFKNTPQASITDNIKDTICYRSICDKLREFSSKKFNTIEACTQKIFMCLDNIIKPHLFKLQVYKFPNIENLNGGVSFALTSDSLFNT